MMNRDSEIEKEVKNSILFSSIFENDKNLQEQVISFIQEGFKMDKMKVLQLLIQEYMNLCGVSLGYRTVVFRFAEEIFEQSKEKFPDHIREQVKDEPFALVMYLLHADYTEEYDKYDITHFEDTDFIIYAIRLLEEGVDQESSAALCYGMYVFYEKWMKEYISYACSGCPSYFDVD